MKTLICTCLLLLLALILKGQSNTISIEQCYRLARQNYPLVQRYEMIEKAKAYSIQNLSKANLPQLSIKGKASYQSEVTQIPIEAPGLPTLSKDQYKLYGEISQNLFDGGLTKAQKQAREMETKVQQQELDVALYQLKNRIAQLYFGVLLIDEQLKQVALLKQDIQLGLGKMEAAVANGVALRSNADVLRAELLKADQQEMELEANRNAYIDMLGMFIHQPLDTATVFIIPEGLAASPGINRPELLLFDYKIKHIEQQNKLLSAKNAAKFSLFFQGGAGRPALNMLSDDFEAYYIGGIRVSIPISGFYTLKKEKALIDIQQSNVAIQKEVFLFNTKLELKEQNAEIRKLQALIDTDNDIITLRKNVKKAALAQLENGMINSNDYIKEVNAENRALQSKILHEMQLLMAQHRREISKGN